VGGWGGLRREAIEKTIEAFTQEHFSGEHNEWRHI
jgi:hypothetical protein